MTVKTKAEPTERELAALRGLERAARRLVRYPDDRAPKQSLWRALRNLDRAREAE